MSRSLCSHWAGISLEQFQNLSPLLLCGEIDLLPGSPVCVGDNLSFCSNHLIFATQKDSCASISSAAASHIPFFSHSLIYVYMPWILGCAAERGASCVVAAALRS